MQPARSIAVSNQQQGRSMSCMATQSSRWSSYSRYLPRELARPARALRPFPFRAGRPAWALSKGTGAQPIGAAADAFTRGAGSAGGTENPAPATILKRPPRRPRSEFCPRAGFRLRSADDNPSAPAQNTFAAVRVGVRLERFDPFEHWRFPKRPPSW